ncbi:GMC family oxidoreductase [uncultured Rummeliibacillus sp.]|uniref:GMC family oxidoreductase n=1 Tax=uncultured Rummeliibacillus sp. TaxID=762292 RepID=UPI002638D56C|nr:GMC family oxidoreductase [uncultured Rummeliibacillus sp.]
MAKTMPKVDIVTVGVGWTGAIVAAECTKAGLKVVGIERGKERGTENFANVHDEYRYAIRYELMQDLSKETITFRNNRKQQALPMRQLGSFLLGEGLGGAGTHWNGQVFRFLPYDFEIKTMTDKKYGKDFLGKDYLYQDWGLTYDEIEPYYDKFEKIAGTGGEENPLGGKRSDKYPNKPMKKTPLLQKFEKATKKLGYHPYMMPSSNMSATYKNPYGNTLNACQYCGFCERFGCEYGAKATPEVAVIPTALKSGKYDIRYNANVVKVLTKGGKATGVKYIDTVSGEEFIQPADVVVLTSYIMNNAKLLMVSNIGTMYDPETGKGTLGRNYCYQIMPGATGFFDEQFNTFMGAGALGISIDDFNGDNFDHSKLGFIHGGNIELTQLGNRPIGNNPTHADTPTWGAEFKKESIKNYTRSLSVAAQGASIPHKENYFTLDPKYKDVYGVPLLQLNYDFTEQDKKLHKFISDKCAEVLKEMGAKTVEARAEITNYNIVPYQSTHNTGGTVMSKTPEDGVVNNYLQHWDCENLFAVGAGSFANNSGYNPTDTVGALALRCAEGIIKYSKKGGSLV